MAKKAYVGIQGDVNLVFDTTFSYNEDQASFMSNDVLPEKFDWGETMHLLSIDINGTLYTGIYIFQDFAQDCWIGSYESNDWSFNFNVWRDQHCEIHNDEELYPFDINQSLNVKVYIGNPTPTARKIKMGYVGIPTEISAYEENDVTVGISNSNITDFFDVTNGTYYFKASSTVFASTNFQVASSSATSTWTAKQDIKNASFEYVVSSESGYDKFTVVVKGVTIANAISGESEGTWTGSLNKGDTIQLTYTKDGSANNGNDCGIVRSFNITYSQKTLISTEIKEVARKVKKAYISIGGFARPTFNNTQFTYYGNITPLSEPAAYVSAESFNQKAIFAGGYNRDADTLRNTIDAYDSSFTKTNPSTLFNAKYQMAITKNNNYLLIAGGYRFDGGNVASDIMDFYNSDFSHSVASVSEISGNNCGGAQAGDYAVLHGPTNGWGMCAFDNGMTQIPLTNTSTTLGFGGCGATTFKECACFGGGYYSTESLYYDHMSYFDSSLTQHTSPQPLSVPRYNVSAATDGEYLIFAGGTSASGDVNTVDCYDQNFTKITTPLLTLQAPKKMMASGSMPEHNLAIFSGGNDSSGNRYATVELFGPSLTHSFGQDMSISRSSHGLAVLSDRLIIAGGYGASTSVSCDTAEAYIMI